MLEIVQNELRSNIIQLEHVKTKSMVLRVLNGIIIILKKNNLVPFSALNVPLNYNSLKDYYLVNEIVDTTDTNYINLNLKLHNLSVLGNVTSVRTLREKINEIILILQEYNTISSLLETFENLRYEMLYQVNSGKQFTFVNYNLKINSSNLFTVKVSELSLLISPITNEDIINQVNLLVSLLKRNPGIATLEDFQNLKLQFLVEEGIDIDYGNAFTNTIDKENYGNAFSDLNSPKPL